MREQLLSGTAFLTGAASGIGKAAAFSLAKNGITKFALTDLNLTHLLATAAELRAQYPALDIETIELNVCDEKAVERSVKTTVERFSRIDIAVNVAGISGTPQKTTDTEESGWSSVIDVNLNGVWRSERAELRAMLLQENLGVRIGRGNIINVASMYGLVATPAELPSSPYVASKHAIIGLTQADAASYADQGIRINALCPGYVDTPLLAVAKEIGAMDGEIAKTPMKRMADAEEIGDCIVFLASPMASFMTGSCLLVDGGYTIN